MIKIDSSKGPFWKRWYTYRNGQTEMWDILWEDYFKIQVHIDSLQDLRRSYGNNTRQIKEAEETLEKVSRLYDQFLGSINKVSKIFIDEDKYLISIKNL